MNSADIQSSKAPEPPASPTPTRRNGKLLTGIGALAVALAIGAVAYAATRPEPTAAVLRIVDGNSLEVTVDGETIQVDLLNVQTPLASDLDEAAACMGPESSEFMETTLPIGSVVDLDQRIELPDRVLARVTFGDVVLNEEVVSLGLGVAVVEDESDGDLYTTVLAAQHEAIDAERGLYSPTVDCTIPHLLASYVDIAALFTEGAGIADALDLPTLEDHSMLGLLLASQVDKLTADLLTPSETAFPMLAFAGEASRAALLPRMTTTLTQTTADIATSQTTVTTAITTKKEEIAAAERAAEAAAAAEAQRVADEAAAEAQRVADEAAAAARRAADQEAQQRAAAAAPRAKAPAATSGTSGSTRSKTPSAGTDTYTGCRAYGPAGTSIDNKGRRYTKISCS